MIVIFGGAYQGKLDFVKRKFNILDSDVNNLLSEEVNYDKKVLYHVEKLVRDKNLDLTKLDDKILIFNDESQGLVPINEVDRAYREDLGRTITKLNLKAEEVYRVFFGIGERLK